MPPILPQLATDLRAYMKRREMGLRELEAEIGISKATLSRACRGMGMSAEVYIRIVRKIYEPAHFSVERSS